VDADRGFEGQEQAHKGSRGPEDADRENSVESVSSILSVLGLKLYLEFILTINRIDTAKFYD
jgi:hypothetical protein